MHVYFLSNYTSLIILTEQTECRSFFADYMLCQVVLVIDHIYGNLLFEIGKLVLKEVVFVKLYNLNNQTKNGVIPFPM